MLANKVDPFVQLLLRRYVQRGHRVVDIGCGPAPYKESIDGEYIGVDVTDEPYRPDMPRRVDVVASASDLPFEDGCIDLVFSKSAFFLVPDPDRALHEFHRVLKDGGRLLLVDYNRRTQRYLQALENVPRPCWTQWQLRSRVRQAGFGQCELLAPVDKNVGRMEKGLRIIHQELFGTWAIVTAVK